MARFKRLEVTYPHISGCERSFDHFFQLRSAFFTVAGFWNVQREQRKEQEHIMEWMQIPMVLFCASTEPSTRRLLFAWRMIDVNSSTLINAAEFENRIVTPLDASDQSETEEDFPSLPQNNVAHGESWRKQARWCLLWTTSFPASGSRNWP